MAETLTIATFAAPLSRDGPGLLLRDLGREDAQIEAVAGIVAAIAPDILLLTDVDHDLDGLAIAALADRLGYDHAFAAPPNTGVPTGLDLDGNGRLGEARDAQGYGRFRGDGGLAVLARWPVTLVADHTRALWADQPGAVLPEGEPQAVRAVQRLSTTAHWEVSVAAPDGPLGLLAWSATPPVFDGPEDRNGRRNRDELMFWKERLSGQGGPFVLLGNANLDPVDGEGWHADMAALLAHPALQDPRPASPGAALAADAAHLGDPALDTVDWPDGRPGNLRVSYVLPSRDWAVLDAGVFWPAPDTPEAALLGADGLAAGPHRLVWVTVQR